MSVSIPLPFKLADDVDSAHLRPNFFRWWEKMQLVIWFGTVLTHG